MLKNWDWKYIGVAVLLTVGVIASYIFRSEIFVWLKTFFELENLNFWVGGAATILMLTHKIKTRKFKFSATMSFNEFRIPVEDILSFIGNPITLVCSVSLAKGLFLQTTHDINYFPFFQSLELNFIGLVTMYLFFVAIMDLRKVFVETFINGDSKTEDPIPIPESEIANKKIPDIN